MQKKHNLCLPLILFFLSVIFNASGQVGISDTGAATPDQKAILDLSSETKGVLLPRLTTIQMSSLIPAPDGLLIYNTDSSRFYFYNGSLGGWQSLTVGNDTIRFICGARFQDPRDGLLYNTVQIGSQCWMAENLHTAIYRDGSVIPDVPEASAWAALTTGAYCWFDDDSASFESVYGKLYNWYAVMDNRGLCPSGWHIPSDAEYTALTDYLGGEDVAGGKMKETGLDHWHSPNTGATNESGFTGRPGGYRFNNGGFYTLTLYGEFWTSTEFDPEKAYFRCLHHIEILLHRDPSYKRNGLYVRCIKD